MTVPGSYKTLLVILDSIEALETIHKKIIYESERPTIINCLSALD